MIAGWVVKRLAQVALAVIITCSAAGASATACIDAGDPGLHIFKGTLHVTIQGGPADKSPYTSNDSYSAYFLSVDEPVCLAGDDFVSPKELFRDIQLTVDDGPSAQTMLQSNGKTVAVATSEVYGAHTAHHRAPLVAHVVSIMALK